MQLVDLFMNKPGKREPAIHDQIRCRTRNLLEQAGRHFSSPMPPVDVRFDLKGRSAGLVCFQRWRRPLIRYNDQLLMTNQCHFLAHTVTHEVAHVVARALFGKVIRPHGPEWRAVMEFFGLEAKRCHDYDTNHIPTRQLKRFEYNCSCRQHILTSIRHNRVLKGQRYYCRNCGQALTRASKP